MIVTETKSFNEFLTKHCNGIHIPKTKRVLYVLERAYKINTEKQMPFEYDDFSELTNGSFRQIIHKIRPLIEVVVRSRPCMYKLKGIELPGDYRKITHRVMGAGIMEILERLRQQPPAIHDIKLKFDSDIHQFLAADGAPVEPSNNGIKLDLPNFDDKNYVVKAMVYPNTVQLDIGCTFKPIVYEISGVLQLAAMLGSVKNFLFFLDGFRGQIPLVNKWIITHYHFGKDGSESYSGQSFHYTFEDAAEGMIRFYSKKMPDGKMIPRFEQVSTPNHSLSKELDRMISLRMTD